VSIADRIRNMPVEDLAAAVQAKLPPGQTVRVVGDRIELLETGCKPARLSTERLRHDLIIHARLSARP